MRAVKHKGNDAAGGLSRMPESSCRQVLPRKERGLYPSSSEKTDANAVHMTKAVTRFAAHAAVDPLHENRRLHKGPDWIVRVRVIPCQGTTPRILMFINTYRQPTSRMDSSNAWGIVLLGSLTSSPKKADVVIAPVVVGCDPAWPSRGREKSCGIKKKHPAEN